jgi:predicted membrane-bound spermidine synthase
VLYALDLAGACAGALALSVLLIPVYGFLRTAALMAAVNLAPAVMAAASGRERRGSDKECGIMDNGCKLGDYES